MEIAGEQTRGAPAARGREREQGSATARMLSSVRELCSFERRLPGSDAERRAANHLAQRLRELGRRVEVEPTHVHPQFALVHAAHCALGFAGSLVAVASAPAGFVIVLLAATSMYLDLNGRAYLLRRLFFRRASQNVVSPGLNPGAPGILLVVAHCDAARGGAAFGRRSIALAARIDRLLPFPYGPSRLLFWSLAVLLPLLGARMAGLDSGVLALLQLPPTLILLIGVFGLVDVQLSDPVPGANDNASGVAVALELARELRHRPPAHLDVWTIFTGGEECLAQGMRTFLRTRAVPFERAGTFVLNLDSVGRGELRYVASQGPAVSFEMDRRLLELCAGLAETGGEAGGRRAEPLHHGFADDALAARIAGLRAVSLTALEPGGLLPPDYHTARDLPDRVQGEALERARGFAADLIAALDRDLVRAAARAGEHPAG